MKIKQRPLPDSWPHLEGLEPLLQRIYAARGIVSSDELDQRLQRLLPFHGLKDIDKACQRLHRALAEKERILIIGDFDADGATSTALAVSALEAMGGESVNYLVPNRFAFGYGLTPGIVEVAKKSHPQLIVTVDNGISSIAGVDAANAAGIDVIVTDHHLAPDTLPLASAIVNPNQAGDSFPSKAIAGVGVIFYVMLALRRYLSTKAWFHAQRPEPNMAQFLDLVALGTVADVVPLDQNNRILVRQGLLRIRQGLARPGIKALIDVSGRDASLLRESDLGFALGPRLNAAGRLDDMSRGINCLLCKDPQQAALYAKELHELNKERRLIEDGMKEQAFSAIGRLIKNMEQRSSHLPIALCLMDESWHQGVIGILAGRLKERYHRPVIAFALVNEELKGSARSVPGLNVRDVLVSIDKDKPGLLSKFGGHAMAAGLSLHKDDFFNFREAFIQEVSRHLDLSQCEGEILTDGALTVDELNLDTARLLQRSGPWGQQFPEPCFNNDFEILDQRLLGEKHLKLTLMHEEGGGTLNAIAFNVDLKSWPNHRAKRVNLSYKLDVNVYQGCSRLQLMVESLVAKVEN